MSCKCMRLASRSAIESASSANCGSRASSGASFCELVDWAWVVEARKEEREEGRRGVVGRDVGERERVRLRGWVGRGWDIVPLDTGNYV